MNKQYPIFLHVVNMCYKKIVKHHIKIRQKFILLFRRMSAPETYLCMQTLLKKEMNV